MCGIFGYVRHDASSLSIDTVEQRLARLFKLSETRGKEAAGLAVFSGGRLSVYKDAVSASEMIRSKEYKQFIRRAFPTTPDGKLQPFALIGHTRLVTNGSQVVDDNNQPVVRDGIALVHNGIVVNDAALWQKLAAHGRKPVSDLDSEVLAALVEQKIRDEALQPESAVQAAIAEVFGETSVGFLIPALQTMVLASNTGSIFLCTAQGGGELFFVSERHIASQAMSGKHALSGFEKATIEQIGPRSTRAIALAPASKDLPAPAVTSRLAEHVEFELKEHRLAEQRKKLRRCSKCVLPETMPYIEFDAQGVCNYCRVYKPRQLQGDAALHAEVAKFKPTRPGEPNCIVSFSGGRDSSYGLHYVVNVLGLRPVAYTYDWGMVTDLGRRNQARMCDRLGVEHIWVSADIRMKRENIRRNVSAWMKSPHLGTVPLFMAGDKHFFYFANDVMKKMEIPNLLMCVNDLEVTHFKAAFAGVRPKALSKVDKTEHVHSLPMGGAIAMAGFYAGQFLSNPRYINASMWDTFEGYASYYLMKQPHLDVFKYIEWREDVVEKALLGQYDWELARDTKTTWRIGDGTAPFYNYIYHSVLALTEFDTFRSNQIREGHITREQGLELVDRDNRPRWESMREYFSMINIDMADAVRAVSRMQRMYG